ncbi:MAG: hypothetical protein R6X33_13985 [Candidatus Brocadiia bacterium]
MKRRNKGWRFESERHALASNGIKTRMPKNESRDLDVYPEESKLLSDAQISKDDIENFLESIDAELIEISPSGYNRYRAVEVETTEGRFVIARDYDSAILLAEDRVREDLKENPSIFEDWFIEQHSYLGDTDKRVMLSDEFSYYIDTLEHEHPNWSDERLEEEAQKRVDNLESELERNPYQYFKGWGYSDDYILNRIMGIDYEEASKEAVRLDGAENYLSWDDGEIHDVPNSNVVYWKV